jgi:hypothetical protein
VLTVEVSELSAWLDKLWPYNTYWDVGGGATLFRDSQCPEVAWAIGMHSRSLNSSFMLRIYCELRNAGKPSDLRSKAVGTLETSSPCRSS